MKCVRLSDVESSPSGMPCSSREGDHAAGIVRKVLLGEHELPGSVRLSHALLAPGQSVAEHSHDDLFEVFYVLGGQGVLMVNGKSLAIAAGSCFVVEPGELHALGNDGSGDLTLIYFGLFA
ncbi:cupin domain-containing protein [Mariprofundus erugo]|uniref:Cupin domain-containing protein n=1 Tax=Mariprofundus erugo TaxID=2528639 RepID=A0A5R9GJ71_9PROT|nr:cupin domain-containing protein [Mariprofundus erugo]TLS66270.1 cupin domain-containing protein [Mariprofundus erugo]